MILSIGLILYGCGAFLQILEEYEERGLTDTTFKSLALLVIGPTLVSYEAYTRSSYYVVIATSAPAAIALLLILMKLRDVIKTRITRP